VADLGSFVTDDLTSFEQIVTNLSRFTDFQQTGLAFFTVRAIVRVQDPGVEDAMTPIATATRKNILPIKGAYRLQSGASYDAEMYTFSARREENDAGTKLHVTSDKEDLEFPLDTVRILDSRYDLQRFRVATRQQITAIFAVLRIYLTTEGDRDVPRADILLPVVFRGSISLAIIRVALTGVGSSAPAMIAAYTADKLSVGIAVLMLFFGLVAGVGAVFPFWKSSS
jgi:hypothetical protein